ncbi:hypothetical protein OS493_004483 [Desmophyllum pertusum]|uniref:Guanylate-binding protein n=1 Tax=Desmophyllum pertusum TaxID=174260 RepID=A0A9W9ZG94_9CNID|nr:hypothetical protein OS493_004483 [Desmophyllum pertusum]
MQQHLEEEVMKYEQILRQMKYYDDNLEAAYKEKEQRRLEKFQKKEKDMQEQMERLENKLRKAEREKEELAMELRMTKEEMQEQKFQKKKKDMQEQKFRKKEKDMQEQKQDFRMQRAQGYEQQHTYEANRTGDGLSGQAIHSAFRGSMASQTRGQMATPLCLPNNCKWDSRSGQYITTGEKRCSLYVVEEALENLRKIKGPVCVVSIAGPYRNGKSYVLCEAFSQPQVFRLGHHMEPETMGIWSWIVPGKFKVFKVQDSSAGAQESGKVPESILSFFPGFEAFTLPPPTLDPEMLKSINDNKGHINPLFFSGLEDFKRLLRNILVPKNSFNDGELVTGEGLAALVEMYVQDINTPSVINVQSVWDTFVETKCSDATRGALDAYEVAMTSQLKDKLPCDNDQLRGSHGIALENSEGYFMAETAGISTNTIEMYLKKLKEFLSQKLHSWQVKNAKLTREFCIDLLIQLKQTHLDPALQQLQRKEGAKLSFEDIIGGYNRIKDDYNKSAIGAKDVIAAVFFEFHPALMKEQEQYLGLLRQLKDYDEMLTQELAAKAYQEQERQKLEKFRKKEKDMQEQMKMMERQADIEKQRYIQRETDMLRQIAMLRSELERKR